MAIGGGGSQRNRARPYKTVIAERVSDGVACSSASRGRWQFAATARVGAPFACGFRNTLTGARPESAPRPAQPHGGGIGDPGRRERVPYAGVRRPAPRRSQPIGGLSEWTKVAGVEKQPTTPRGPARPRAMWVTRLRRTVRAGRDGAWRGPLEATLAPTGNRIATLNSVLKASPALGSLLDLSGESSPAARFGGGGLEELRREDRTKGGVDSSCVGHSFDLARRPHPDASSER